VILGKGAAPPTLLIQFYPVVFLGVDGEIDFGLDVGEFLATDHDTVLE
jgi:hypothetical protein